jgi:CCR4-NOT transcriptional complex subunit CAF120
MNEGDGSQLQNVLSISTAANNRYLLHFNSLNSLTQWTAGIRLAIYEYATLQEAYTGSLVAGKGKTLNNIRQILERNKFKHEDWARVRFGAGTPWRRCWFVISPPDEKDWERAQKLAKKNKYSKPPVLKGDVKFYETRKITKRTRPIATITNAYSAYAIYPQSKPLIDQSTLVKIEGKITIHSMPESITEGFVFVMPEVHPAISGFEMMLRFLFPIWDTFALYGRPQRLIADVLDQRGLMFAMPRDRRYGYLETLDVAGLIHSDGSTAWTEPQWRGKMKELTSKRMLALGEEPHRKTSSRTSLPGARNSTLRFDDSGRNTPAGYNPPRRAESAMAGDINRGNSAHRRSASDANGLNPYQRDTTSRLNHSTSAIDKRDASPTRPPPHSAFASSESVEQATGFSSGTPSPDRDIPPEVQAIGTRAPPPAPVDPPSFNHAPSEKPRTLPNQKPELRRVYSNLDEETRAQMAEATNPTKFGQLGHSAPAYGQNGNGYGQPPYAMQGGSRGTSPDSRPGAEYRVRSPPSAPRLATIPASPFVEQESPVLDRAGSVIPPPTVLEHAAPKMAQSAAMAALAATSSYSRSSSPGEQTNNLQQVASAGSGKSAASGLGHTFSVQRKPVGSRASVDYGAKQNQTAVNAPPNAQWNSQQYQYQARGSGYGQSDPYAQAQGPTYPPSSAPGGAEMQPASGQYLYDQPGSNYHGGYPPQHSPPPPPVHGEQIPYRPALQNGQSGQPQGQGWT